MSVTAIPQSRAGASRAVYALTIFTSASLLFFVQPLFAKMVLPRLGGAPAVWTTAMLFFQTALLVGYAYAHFVSTRLRFRHQLGVHAALWALGLVFLPIAVPEAWAFDPEARPAIQTLVVLALGVGVPFVALAANAPLLQKWYARTDGPSADDPYHLYAASNAGSLIALLGYPFVAEPLLGARALSLHWSALYVVLGAGLALCAVLARFGQPRALAGRAAPAPARPPAARVAKWVGLAFVPSSMMLGVTAIVSTDLGAFPLVWAIPLALYLLTFILAFAERLRVPDPVMRLGFLVSVPGVIIPLALEQFSVLGWVGFALLFSAFFWVALLFHSRLYAARPPESALTWFYFSMAAGGALGGLFNSILAPMIFTDTIEALVVFALAGLALPGRWRPGRDVAFAAARVAFVVAVLLAGVAGGVLAGGSERFLGTATILAAGVLLVAWQRPLRFALTATGLLAAGYTVFADNGVVHRERSFFGVYTVRDEAASELRSLVHGTTEHGVQFLADRRERPRVLGYYHPLTPLGQLFRSDAAGPEARIGVVGLGVGALACYAAPGQQWRFYEIDRVVDEIARDPALFDYMDQCAGDAPTIIGDARIVLEREAPTPFDILVIDAYSSDAIPVHLITLEALRLYRARLAPGGVLALHITNRYFDLAPILANAAERLGMPALVQRRDASADAPLAPGQSPSRVVLMAAEPAALAPFAADPAWRPLTSNGGVVWTDDRANLLSAL